MGMNLVKLFTVQRQIFGVCPCCGEIFRLSDAKVFRKGKLPTDWLEQLKNKQQVLDARSEKLWEKKEEIQEAARDKGYKAAKRAMKRIDPVFAKLGLDPDDSKVIFHPVDFVMFRGLKNKKVKNLAFVDKAGKDKRIQKSIEGVVSKGKYEWQTLRVSDDGDISEC